MGWETLAPGVIRFAKHTGVASANALAMPEFVLIADHCQ
jgi:hypothetical protein